MGRARASPLDYLGKQLKNSRNVPGEARS